MVNCSWGANLLLMNLHKRVLSVLGCQFVDDVLLDAPWKITHQMVVFLNIVDVVHGTRSERCLQRAMMHMMNDTGTQKKSPSSLR